MPTHKLTDRKIASLKPAEKSYRVSDGGSLNLLVSLTGNKSWQVRTLRRGKPTIVTLGTYPTVQLTEARKLRDAVKERERKGVDPSLNALSSIERVPFRDLANDWFTEYEKRVRDNTRNTTRRYLNNVLLPELGDYTVGEFTRGSLVLALRKISDKRGIIAARRIAIHLEKILDQTCLDMDIPNPAASIGKHLLPPLPSVPRAAVTELDKAREMLAIATAVPGHYPNAACLRFCVLTASRPYEATGAQWSEIHDIDGSNPRWIIPASRMKMGRQHDVPLSRQAVSILRFMWNISGNLPSVFPAARNPNKPTGSYVLSKMMRDAGISDRQTAHGFRATFSTLANEAFPNDAVVIETCLAHYLGGIAALYNRGTMLERRKELMQWWADQIEPPMKLELVA